MKEIWKPITGFAGRYEISTFGRVRSHKTNRILRTSLASGYPHVVLSHEGRLTGHYVHRLVLRAFVGPCPHGMEGAHLDGCRHHNWLGNLAWKTPVANQADRKQHGTYFSGVGHHSAKLEKSDLVLIRQTYLEGGYTMGELAAYFKVSRKTIGNVVNRKCYKYD